MNYFKEKDVKKIKSFKFDFIQWHEKDYVFNVILNRPNKKNALHPQMINEIAFVFQYVSLNNNLRALVLKANGDVFCSGLDLKAIGGDVEKNNSTVPKPNSKILISEIFDKLYKPKICQLEGDVYAGGFLLIAGCNYVVSVDGLKFGLPEVKRGIFPMQVMESLSKIMSVRNVIDWCVRGYNLDVKKAKKWGLVSKIAKEAEIESVVFKWLREVTSNSPIAIKYGMEAIDKISSSKSNYKYLSKMLDLVLVSDDAKEGVIAFNEKRKPNWK
jgi:enoyl-CoA hydratase/carnithine racemase